jgi:hypothetical protein
MTNIKIGSHHPAIGYFAESKTLSKTVTEANINLFLGITI